MTAVLDAYQLNRFVVSTKLPRDTVVALYSDADLLWLPLLISEHILHTLQVFEMKWN